MRDLKRQGLLRVMCKLQDISVINLLANMSGWVQEHSEQQMTPAIADGFNFKSRRPLLTITRAPRFSWSHGKWFPEISPSLSLEKNCINILAKILQIKYIDMPYDLLQLFSRTRFFIRLKYLNNEMKVLEKTIKRRYTIHVNKFI